MGCAPIISFHYGAENKNEVKNMYRKSLIITGTLAVIMTMLGVVLAMPISRIFVGYDQNLLDMAGRAMRIYSVSFLVCGFNIFGSAFFTALNNGFASAVISFLRTLVLQVLSILILPAIWGIDGIWVAIIVAEGLTLIVTFWLFKKKRVEYSY